MKILMTLVMTMAMTSAFAQACKLGSECSKADCEAISPADNKYSIVGGKCIDLKAGETKTDCAGINGTAAAKGQESGAPAAKDSASGAVQK